MTISPWLTFESIKELQESITNIGAVTDYVTVNSTGALPTNIGTDAIGIGRQAFAFQARVVAIGDFAVATFSDAIAIGTSSQASNSSAVAIGEGANAGGTESVALGFGANVSIVNSAIAIGSSSEVLASGGIAIGGSSDITGAASNGISIGINSEVSATGGVQLGAGTNSVANSLQFQSNPIANTTGIIAGSSSGAPAGAGATNEMRFDASTNILYIYNGSAWVSTTLTP